MCFLWNYTSLILAAQIIRRLRWTGESMKMKPSQCDYTSIIDNKNFLSRTKDDNFHRKMRRLTTDGEEEKEREKKNILHVQANLWVSKRCCLNINRRHNLAGKTTNFSIESITFHYFQAESQRLVVFNSLSILSIPCRHLM